MANTYFRIRVFILCFSVAFSATVTEIGLDQQENIIALFMDKLDDMQATIDHLEASETSSMKRIADLEKKLKGYESMETNNWTKTVPREERRPDISPITANNSTEVISHRQKRADPSHVAFTVYLDYIQRNLGRDQPVVFNRVLLNDGHGYSVNTGIFNVPTTGVYLFSWSVTAKKILNEHPYEVWVKLVINGNHMLGAVAESRNDTYDSQGSNSIVVHCSQYDEVWISHYSLYPDLFGDDNERTTSFMGVLLYS
ncbi:Complement component C1q domain [Mactra antiquata]